MQREIDEATARTASATSSQEEEGLQQHTAMGRAPCCNKATVTKGPWSPEEDRKLKEYIHKHGTGGNWIALPLKAGLKRCGKSCRLRWLNYLRPNIKHGDFSGDEDRIICSLFATIGSRWSIIASQLPGRTDNDIKNYWNTKLKKKLMLAYGLHPPTTANSHHKSKKQQTLFFSAEAPSSPSPPGDGDPLLLQSLLTPGHNISHHHYSSLLHCYDDTSTSHLSTGSVEDLLMLGGNNGEQQMMSSSCSDCLGPYFEFGSNGTPHGHEDKAAVEAGPATESFILQDDHHKAPPPLLAEAASLDHQYGANTSGGYEEATPLLVNVEAGNGDSNGPDESFYCNYEEEKSSSSPGAAGVSQQGSFMY